MPVIVQTVTSTVSALWGRSYIRDANGKFRLLKLEEVVVRGDMILTEQNAIVQLTEDLKADAAPAAPRVAKARMPETDDMDRVIAGLEKGDIQFATAAGTSAGDGGLTPATIVERLVETAPAGLDAPALPFAPAAFSLAAAPLLAAAPPTVTVASPFPAQLAPTVQAISGATETEGTALVFPVQLSGADTQALTLPFVLTLDTASAADLGSPVFSNGVLLNGDGTITVPAGVSDFVVTVPTVNDSSVEAPERLSLSVGGVSATGLINDNDQPFITSVEPGVPGAGDDAVVEGRSLVYTVNFSEPAASATLYPFSIGGDSASSADHGAPQFSNGVVLNDNGTLTVPAGVASFSITVPTVDDSGVENSEILPLAVGGVMGIGTILDNDGVPPTIPTVTGIEPGDPGVGDDRTPEGTDLVYTVQLSAPGSVPAAYAFNVGGGSAAADDMAEPVFSNGVQRNADGSITVPAGVSSFTVTVPTVQDSAIEDDESVPLTIGGLAANATDTVTATGVIVDDDRPPTVTGIEPGLPGTGDDRVVEGQALTFNVTLSAPASRAVSYPFSLGGGSAAAGDIGAPVFSDGVVLNADGSITVPAGVAAFTVTVPSTQDTLLESDETVPLRIGGLSATGTIVDDDDGRPTVTRIEPGLPGAADDSVIEGDTLSYTVTLSGPTTAPVTYPFALGGGSADAADVGTPTFTNGVTLNPDGTITVPAGVSSFEVLVPTTQDSAVEGNEELPLSIGGVDAVGTIVDDDSAPPFVTGIEPGQPGAADDSVTEGNTLTYTVALSGPTTAPVTYPFALGGGTAGAGDIGTPTFTNGVTLNPDGTITVPAGVETFDVLVPTTQDGTVESDESVPLSIGGVDAVGSIVDDDNGPPTVTGIELGQPGVADDSVTEGGTLAYTVTLSAPTTAPVTYPFALGGGTAGAGDVGSPTFTNGVTLNPDGTITVPAGVSSFEVLVPTTQDTAVEGNETVPLNIGGVEAVGTINDDDSAPPTVTGIEPGQPGVADDSVTEGGTLAYTVTLSAPTTAPVTYPFALGGGTAGAGDLGTPTFTNGVTLNPDGTITVPAGVSSFEVQVPTTQDTAVEGNETVPLNIGGVEAVGTINDDDGTPPTVTGIEPGQPGPGDDSVTEGGTLAYTVTLSAPTTAPVTYPFALGGGTAGAGDVGSPTFTNGVTLNPDGTITVPAGVSSFEVQVPTAQDTAVEGDETVPLNIGGVEAVGTINDDDSAPPTVTGIEPGQPGVADNSVTEGGTLAYTVTLSGPTTAPVTYPFALGGGTAGTGDVGSPTFTNGVTLNPDGTITVPVGVSSFEVLVSTTQDTAVEGNETVPLNIGGVEAIGTINDDDRTPPTVTGIEPGQPGVADNSVTEGGTLAYTVTLSGPTTAPVTYPFALGGGTAGAGDLGTPTFTNGVTLNPDGTITVPASVSSFEVLVPTAQDTAVEGNETVPLNIGGVEAIGTINDDDSAPPTVTGIEPGQPGPGDDSVTEGGTLAYTVTLSGPTTVPVTYPFALGAGTAGAGDIGSPTFTNGVTLNPDGTITVPAGVSSFEVLVPTAQDTAVEGNETVPLNIGGVEAIGTINDDDSAPPTVTGIEPGQPGPGDDSVTEGGTLAYTVTLSGPTTVPVTYPFALGAGTAGAGDIGSPTFTNGVTLNPDGTITVPAGVSSFEVLVPTTQDTAVEGNETVPLNIGGVEAIGTINDDDSAPPTVTGIEPGLPGAGDNSVTEGGTLAYTVTLSAPTTAPVTYPFALGGGTAGAGDVGSPTFTNGVTLNPDGTITVPAGVSSFEVLVPTTQDTAVEGNETVPLNIGGVEAIGTINDDDSAPPTVTGIEPGQPGPGDDSVTEGGTLAYTVTLSGPTTVPVIYPFALGAGTAGAGDIGSPTFTNGVTLNPDGTITVPAGVSSFEVLVPTTQDTAVEGNETVPLNIGGVEAIGTINDDDSTARRPRSPESNPASQAQATTASPKAAHWPTRSR